MAELVETDLDSDGMPTRPKDLLLIPEADGLSSGWAPRKISGGDPSRSPSRRKLSESRGVNLPDIKLHPESVVLTRNVDNVLDTPLPTASPLSRFNLPPFDDRRSPRTHEQKLTEILDICIYLPDNRGLVFKVEGLRCATASHLLRMVYEHQGISDYEKADQIFALWMCSPLLEIQLKPHHCPFAICQQWTKMLRRFTDCSKEQLLVDEPTVMIRRNVYLSNRRQLQLTGVGDPETDVLYRDAKTCITTGIYPCPLEICLQLTAYDMAITCGPYSSSVHTVQFIRNKTDELMPLHHAGAVKRFSIFGWSLPTPSCHGIELHLMDLYKTASALNPSALKWEYLMTCMKIPVYGAAFFRGYVERPATLGSAYAPVSVAISREYVCILDTTKYTSLLTVPVEDCSWQKINQPTEAELRLPSFYVHFPENEDDPSGGGLGKSRLVQIFSKQAVMMDALLNSSVQIRMQEVDMAQENGEDEEDSQKGPDQQLVSTRRDGVLDDDLMYKSKLTRLCTATIDSNGRCSEARGLLKIILNEPN